MKLNELLPFSEHESVDIDYKLYLGKNNPKSWAKSIVAFSNLLIFRTRSALANMTQMYAGASKRRGSFTNLMGIGT